MDNQSAPTLLYAARKYLLPRLTECCSKYLQSILNINNACAILTLSFFYEAEDLKRQCIEFVANNSETVLNRDELLTLSRESFEAILKVDRIMKGKVKLFNSSVKWAKHQLRNKQCAEAPNDLQIRETLGSFLYEIPFPAIGSVTEFAKLVGDSDILTGEEKSTIYYYLASKQGKDKLKFKTEDSHERKANLATRIIKGLWPHSKCFSCNSFKKHSFEISFKTNKDILLTGIGLFKRHDGSDYAVDIQVIQATEEEYSPLPKRPHLNFPFQTLRAPESRAQGTSLFTGSKRIVPHTGSSTTFKVYFDEPVSISQGKLYEVCALAYKESGYYGELCRESVVDDVTFTVVSASSNSSGVCYGCSRCGAISKTKTCNSCIVPHFGLLANNSAPSAVVTYGQIPKLYYIPKLS